MWTLLCLSMQTAKLTEDTRIKLFNSCESVATFKARNPSSKTTTLTNYFIRSRGEGVSKKSDRSSRGAKGSNPWPAHPLAEATARTRPGAGSPRPGLVAWQPAPPLVLPNWLIRLTGRASSPQEAAPAAPNIGTGIGDTAAQPVRWRQGGRAGPGGTQGPRPHTVN